MRAEFERGSGDAATLLSTAVELAQPAKKGPCGVGGHARASDRLWGSPSRSALANAYRFARRFPLATLIPPRRPPAFLRVVFFLPAFFLARPLPGW